MKKITAYQMTIILNGRQQLGEYELIFRAENIQAKTINEMKRKIRLMLETELIGKKSTQQSAGKDGE